LYVNSGATLHALGTAGLGTGEVTVSANSNLTPRTTASTGSGGLFAGSSSGTTASADYTTRTQMDGAIIAADTATVAAHTSITGAYVSASNDVGGLGVDGSSDATLNIGQSSGSNEVDIQSNGRVTGNHVDASAIVDHLDGVVTTDTEASAFGAGSSASATINAAGTTQVRLEAGSYLTGNIDTTIDSAYSDINYYLHAHATCHCFGGSTNANTSIDDTTVAHDAGISASGGTPSSTIKTSNLTVLANQFVTTPFDQAQDSSTSKAFLDFGNGGDTSGNEGSLQREIYFESTVIMLPTPDPQLTIDANGQVTTDVNVTAYDCPGGVCGATPLKPGDHVGAGDLIYVAPIINDRNGTILFQANDLTDNAPLSQIWGNAMLLKVQDTWDFVKVDNYSGDPMITHEINVINQTATVDVTITVNNVPFDSCAPNSSCSYPDGTSLSETSGGVGYQHTFEFLIDHTDVPTHVEVQNLTPGTLNAGGTDHTLTLDGEIYNPLGDTQITDELGDTLAGSDQTAIETNILRLNGDGGSIGCESGTSCGSGRTPIVVWLIQYKRGGIDRPEVLTGEAQGDLVLNIESICRETASDCLDSNGYANATLGPLMAGGSIDLKLLDSLQGDDQGQIGPISVKVNATSGFTYQNPNPHNYENDFHPDGDGPAIDTGVLMALGTTNVAVNSDYTFTDPPSALAEPGLIAGTDIYVHHDSQATDLTLTLYTVVDGTFTARNGQTFGSADNTGRIDLYTNGSIVDTENRGNLRVGQIESTGVCASSTLCPAKVAADVTLNSPAAVLDASGDAAPASDRPTTTATNVIARNIAVTAGDNGLGLGSSESGRGGVGTPNDFLLVQVNADGKDAAGDIGALTITDTAATRRVATSTATNLPPDAGTYGVFVTQTKDRTRNTDVVGNVANGDMAINTVTTTGDASLTTQDGSILD
ncbi:MAG: hypothetical protein ACRDTP_05085, partial [Mycobacteriales bacterium]